MLNGYNNSAGTYNTVVAVYYNPSRKNCLRLLVITLEYVYKTLLENGYKPRRQNFTVSLSIVYGMHSCWNTEDHFPLIIVQIPVSEENEGTFKAKPTIGGEQLEFDYPQVNYSHANYINTCNKIIDF